MIAHSPLGGPRRAGSLARRRGPLAEIADARGATPAEVALAWLLQLSPVLVAIPGARRPETARSAARAASLVLSSEERAALNRAFGGSRPARPESRDPADGAAEVILVMGIPGAGKSRVAEEYVARGYIRLNRDEREELCASSRTRSMSTCLPALSASYSTTPTSRGLRAAT